MANYIRYEKKSLKLNELLELLSYWETQLTKGNKEAQAKISEISDQIRKF